MKHLHHTLFLYIILYCMEHVHHTLFLYIILYYMEHVHHTLFLYHHPLLHETSTPYLISLYHPLLHGTCTPYRISLYHPLLHGTSTPYLISISSSSTAWNIYTIPYKLFLSIIMCYGVLDISRECCWRQLHINLVLLFQPPLLYNFSLITCCTEQPDVDVAFILALPG